MGPRLGTVVQLIIRGVLYNVKQFLQDDMGKSKKNRNQNEGLAMKGLRRVLNPFRRSNEIPVRTPTMGNSKRKAEAVQPSPKVLMRPFTSQGFLESPVTIDETLSDGTRVVELLSPPEKKRRVIIRNETIEEGEIVDDPSLETAESVGCSRMFDLPPKGQSAGPIKHDVITKQPLLEPGFQIPPESPEIQITRELLKKKGRWSTPKRTIRFKNPFKDLNQKLAQKKKKKRGKGSRHHQQQQEQQQQQHQYHGFALRRSPRRQNQQFPTPLFNPTRPPMMEFMAGLNDVQGGVFEFQGRDKRIVPRMGVRQVSNSGGHPMSNVFVAPGEPSEMTRNQRGR